MHVNADHHDAELLLRLYDLRREERMRRARVWFLGEFNASSREEFLRVCPPGSDENAFFRMVISYWNMAASIVNEGLIQESFFFENNGEFWAVWEKGRPAAMAMREGTKNPHQFENLEKLAAKYEKWMAERAPGSLDARRAQMAAAAAARSNPK